MSRNGLYIKFRDGINKLMGKQELIKEYNRSVIALAHKSDSLYGKPEQKPLLERLEKITEEERKIEGNSGGFSITSFDPYLIRTSKSKLAEKIAMLHKLMQEYNVK